MDPFKKLYVDFKFELFILLYMFNYLKKIVISNSIVHHKFIINK